ncbi:xyloglucan-specific endo-beta-1,4-glucanase precursor [Eremomyces bilateralis CBS 781.70]|uniref:Xyloglucan-specific endo-beta-1,4-glucanase n=1 Tax=Eremomyces bilateralis CBS 781.70 TaxID=1392243 RepID=A0A6G1GEV3_9PEZI|nr:xyloglucan-specific endo-beta-1,4-glucanase precursor [Eremomyces bilateralis CBS 781.70]KAF1816583.1 xyloglucan-specific endo-beta-1,4-glucanase precursor [Eremomyces bilateralis CBS 781.70]
MAFALVGLSLATPTKTVQKRADMCGQWDSVQTAGYTLYNACIPNMWGMSAGTGRQCTTLNSVSGNTIAWRTTWSWSGGQYNVKSYPNAVVDGPKPQLRNVKSIPSTWKWSYTGSGMVANVAYDIFSSSTASGNPEYEIMIWVGSYGGAGPISNGQPKSVNIAGTAWKLHQGQNNQMKVFSFVSERPVTNFSGDLNAFLTYLRSNNGLPAGQYLTSVGAGTEPFVGQNAVFTTTAYSCAIN